MLGFEGHHCHLTCSVIHRHWMMTFWTLLGFTLSQIFLWLVCVESQRRLAGTLSISHNPSPLCHFVVYSATINSISTAMAVRLGCWALNPPFPAWFLYKQLPWIVFWVITSINPTMLAQEHVQILSPSTPFLRPCQCGWVAEVWKPPLPACFLNKRWPWLVGPVTTSNPTVLTREHD